jgi:hypothetical protein
MKKLIPITIILSFSVFGIRCKKSGNDIIPAEKSITIGQNRLYEPDQGTVSNVVKQANTAEVPLETMTKSFESFDKATGQMTFKSDASELKSLKTGSVVLFTGHSLKKISNVTESGGKIVVKTSAAKFVDYYKSAKIAYKTNFQWNASTLASSRIQVNGDPNARVRHIEGTNEWSYKGKIGNWEMELKLAPETSGENRKLAIQLNGKRGNLGGVEFKGFISNFEIENNISVDNSRVTNYSETHTGANGEIEAKYAFLSLANEDAAFELPIDFFRTMIVHGVIPVTYRLRCVFKVYPQVSANSSSQANLKLTYSGTNGFNYQNNGLTPRATMTNFNPSIIGDTGSASTGIVGVGVGLEFPRFEIGIFDTVVVPYMLMNTSIVNYFESGLPFMPGPCNRTRLTFKGVAGLEMSFLGANFKQEMTLFEKMQEYKTEGSKCPTSTIPFVENAFLLPKSL